MCYSFEQMSIVKLYYFSHQSALTAIYFCLICLLMSSNCEVYSQGILEEIAVLKTDTPDWIVNRDVSNDLNSTIQTEGSARYILVDRQDRAVSKEMYKRFVTAVLTKSGVEEYGTIQIPFSSDYQKLHLHTLTINRDGEILDRLNISEIKILNQEEELQEHVYLGKVSATIFLSDLRVGDILEYAFTIIGQNPAFGDHYSGI